MKASLSLNGPEVSSFKHTPSCFPGFIHLTDSDTRFKTAPLHMRGTKSRRALFKFHVGYATWDRS